MTTTVAALAATISALLLGSPVAAQGISLFGDARLGLGYNIDNDGGVVIDDGNTPDDLRAVSRVRFGVIMAGVSDSGVTFGASIRADNAREGDGGVDGQSEGDVFVSGAWGTLTYGDTNGADEQWVGDVPGDFSLTGLTEIDETRFISNGGSFGDDRSETFAPDPFARPTVRYDYDLGGFGVSLSSNRDLTDIAVGGGYAADLAGGSWSIGVGYSKFASFTSVQETSIEILGDANGDGVLEAIIVPGEKGQIIPGGEQWSAGLNATYGEVSFGVTYMTLNAQSATFGIAEADNLLLGVAWGRGPLSLGAVYGTIFNATGELATMANGSGWNVSAQYDLGGGATVNGGFAHSYPQPGLDDESATIADFGIAMSF